MKYSILFRMVDLLFFSFNSTWTLVNAIDLQFPFFMAKCALYCCIQAAWDYELWYFLASGFSMNGKPLQVLTIISICHDDSAFMREIITACHIGTYISYKLLPTAPLKCMSEIALSFICILIQEVKKTLYSF